MTWYLGYVTYSATKPTITGVSTEEVLVEAPTAVTLTGDNLNLVTSVTFNGTEKVTFAKTTDKTKLTVTVPKGTAVADKELVVTTKFGETATETLSRVAAKAPTVTAISGQKAAGGEVTLTGENLIGLKAVKVYSTTTPVKVYSGSKISVVSPTSAKVTLPALLDNAAYKVEVTTWFATPSGKFDFNVGTVSAPVVVKLATADYTAGVLTVGGDNAETATKVRYRIGSAAWTTQNLVGGAADSDTASYTGAIAEGTYEVEISVDGTTWIAGTTAVTFVVPAPEA